MEMSAADKNELRRQKILAKRKARMAYAAGDRTTLPSTSAPEPPSPTPPDSQNPATAATTVDSTTTTTTTNAAAAAAAAAATSAAKSMHAPPQPLAASLPPLPLNPLGPLSFAAPSRSTPTAPGRLSALAASPRPRLALCLLVGTLVALLPAAPPAVASAAAPATALSAVEAFALLYTALALPALPRWVRRHRLERRMRLSRGAAPEPGGGLLGVVDFLSRASRVFVMLNRAFGELCVFLMAFLLTTDLVARYGYAAA